MIIIWAKATFFFEQLFPVVARSWLGYRSWRFFLGPKSRFFVQKSDFCCTTPILVNDPILALTMTVNFQPWEQFFDFPFRSYSCCRKKIRLTCQKVFPFPTVGAPSASNSPSALSAQALRVCALRARAGKSYVCAGQSQAKNHKIFCVSMKTHCYYLQTTKRGQQCLLSTPSFCLGLQSNRRFYGQLFPATRYSKKHPSTQNHSSNLQVVSVFPRDPH